MTMSRARSVRVAARGAALLAASLGALPFLGASENSVPNNLPVRNAGGHAATFSTQGQVDLTGDYFQAQGSNGRSCASCHIPEEAWSITPSTLQRLFRESEGLHPVFNPLDANNPALAVGSVEERRAAYSMLLTRGVFRRGGALRADREWDLIAADDPHGFATLTRLVQWRRGMPTINFALGSATVNWDGGNSLGSDQAAGRFKTPTLRALAARGPYFHNGTAETLEDVVRHYEIHLGFVFTDEERADLVAFLNAL